MAPHIISFLCCWLMAIALSSQPMRHSNQLTSYDGLGHETVFKIYKDRQNLLWLGTNHGVRSYNGHTVNKIQDSGETGFVYTLSEDDEGHLLAGSSTGLYLVDRETNRLTPIAPDIKDVNAIYGNWVGGNCGLWVKEAGQYRPLPIESSIISKGNSVTDIIPDGKGNVWVSTTKRLVHLSSSDGTIRKYSIPDSLMTGNINRICLIGHQIYIGTRNDGLLTFDTRTHQTKRGLSVPSDVITDVNTDGKRYLYVSTDGNGAYTLDVQQGGIVDEHHGKTDAIYTFWRDQQLGINYFGYYLDGFAHTLFFRHLVTSYQYGDLDTRTLPIRSFCRHRHWLTIGTRKGLYLVDEQTGSIRHYSPDDLGANIVTNIVFFQGQFVVATYEKGLRRLTPDGTLSPLLEKGSFSHLCPSPDAERLFAVGNMGVTVMDERLSVIKQFNSHNSELPDEYLTDILFDTTGKAWIGSLSRLCVYDPLLQTIQSSGFPKGFFNNLPSLKFALAADGEMLAWSGNRIYKSSLDFSHYEEVDIAQRLHIEEISFIRWHEGRYWIGTNQGLFVSQGRDLSSGMLHLSEADGLPSLRFQGQEWQAETDGALWMATDGGIITISQEQQKHLGDSIPGKVVMNTLAWDENKLRAFQPLLLNYSTDLGKMYEWTLDNSTPQVCSDGEMVELGRQWWGRHRLNVWLLGHPETKTELTYVYLPSLLFWACTAIVLLIALSIYLARREAVDTYKAEEDKKKRLAEEARLAKLYERQRLTEDERTDIYHKVRTYLDEHPDYRNVSFRLGDLAEGVGVSPARLSQMFSVHLGTSFADYINRLRIDEFKAHAQDPAYNQYTTVALAEMCGLKKSSFFAAFKKYEGCTPNEWMEREGIERK
ncbi:MAG: helix-turn-helix domain-containing protein [Bacteroidaceae bacterium]|nr:helix-turn-helix domain-containing protein [Bacteroidaceae bacterium]